MRLHDAQPLIHGALRHPPVLWLKADCTQMAVRAGREDQQVAAEMSACEYGASRKVLPRRKRVCRHATAAGRHLGDYDGELLLTAGTRPARMESR